VLGGHGNLLSAVELTTAIEIIRGDLCEAIAQGLSPHQQFCKQNPDGTKAGYL